MHYILAHASDERKGLRRRHSRHPFDLAIPTGLSASWARRHSRGVSGLADLKAYPGGYDRLLTLLAPIWAMSLRLWQSAQNRRTDHSLRSVLDAGAFLIAMGGDHFVSYPLLKAHARRFAACPRSLRCPHRHMEIAERDQ
jgi:agmatinase